MHLKIRFEDHRILSDDYLCLPQISNDIGNNRSPEVECGFFKFFSFDCGYASIHNSAMRRYAAVYLIMPNDNLFCQNDANDNLGQNFQFQQNWY